MRSGRRRRPAEEEGSALIIALIFVTVFSLIVAALLSFTDVGLRASKSYRQQARVAHAADGAIAAATKRYSTTGPCDNYSSPMVQGPAGDAPINGISTIVRCEGPPPAGSKAIQPVNSLLSLGTGADDGITSTDELRLLGDVFSNTTVSTTGTMVVQGEVSARGTCTGPIQTAPPGPLRCAGRTPPAPPDEARGRDPRYVAATTAVPMRREVPACRPGDGWLVALQPGYYDDARALSALTGANCNDRVVWFRPGTYYFDFTFRGGDPTWFVTNPSVVVVAGEPRGWDPEAAERPALAVPGSCKTDADREPSEGVQLIAGGGTRLQVDAGRMELCATPTATGQQIALFGLGPDDPSHTLEATDIIADGFTEVLNAQTLGETPAPATSTASLDSAQSSASLSFSAFRPGVPSGSLIEGVSLRAVHQETGSPVDLTYTASFLGRGCLTPEPVPAAGPEGSRVDLAAACQMATPEDLGALTVTFAAALAAGSTTAGVAVDGVVVEVTYRTPVTHKATAVLASPGFTDAGRALEIGEVDALDAGGPLVRLTADATLASGGATSASLTVAGIGDPPRQTDATITSVKLRVAHRDQGDMGGPVVTVPFGGGVCTSRLPPRPDGITDDRIDLLKDCQLDSPAELRGLTATFTPSLSPGGAAALSRLDGMWLEVVSEGGSGPLPPAVRQARTVDEPTGFAERDAAKVIREAPPRTANATMANGTTSASLTMRDFNSVPLPAGSKIDTAKLRVAHQEVLNVDAVTIGAVVPPAAGFEGGTCSPVRLPSSPTGLATHELDLVQCGFRSPDQMKDLTATYTANAVAVPSPDREPARATTADFDRGQTDGRSINGNTANVRLDANKTSATIALDDYGLPPLPAGSSFDVATLRVAHRDEGDLDVGAVTATVTFEGNTCTVPQPLELRRGDTALSTPDTIDLRACGLTDPSKLTGLRVDYKVALAPGAGKVADASLDGIVLDLTYRPPALDQLDGIELDVVFQAPRLEPLCNDCDLLKVAPDLDLPGRGATRFVSAGTIYAPSAGIDLTMYGLTSQVLTRGVVARTIRLGLQPDPSYKRPTGAIPPEVVNFTAYPERSSAPGVAVSAAPADFGAPNNAKAVREDPPAVAEAALDDAKPTASIDLSGFEGADLRAGADIDAVVLRVRHQDEGSTAEVTVKVGGDLCTTQVLAARPNRLVEDQVDLGDCEARLRDPTRLGDVTVTFTVVRATDRATAIAFLDGVTLQVLSGPMVRASVTFERTRATIERWSVLR